MKKFIKKNVLFLAVLLLVILIIIIQLVIKKPTVSYRVTPKELSKVLPDSGEVSPFKLYDLVSKGDNSIFLIDIRNSDEYAKGHIGKALNIPVLELLQQHSLSLLKKLEKSKQSAIIYGEDQLEANGPWLLLRQVGFKKVKILQGGYSFYRTLPLPDSIMKAKEADYNVEVSQVDTSQFRKAGQVTSKATSLTEKKAPEKVIPVKKKVSTGGGC